MKFFARSALTALCLMATAVPHCLDINLTFDPSVSATFGVNTNSMTSAVAYVAQEYENLYTNPITINFSVDGGTSGYAGSSTQWNTYSYHADRKRLAANATSPGTNARVVVPCLPAMQSPVRVGMCRRGSQGVGAALGNGPRFGRGGLIQRERQLDV